MSYGYRCIQYKAIGMWFVISQFQMCQIDCITFQEIGTKCALTEWHAVRRLVWCYVVMLTRSWVTVIPYSLVALVVFFIFLYMFLLYVFSVLTVFFLLFCSFMVASSMGLCLSGNIEIIMITMMMIQVGGNIQPLLPTNRNSVPVKCPRGHFHPQLWSRRFSELRFRL